MSRLLTSGIAFEKSSLSTTLLPVRLQWATSHHNGFALLDSGADGNFLDITLAHKLKVPVIPLTQPISVNDLGGQALSSVTHSTGPVSLTTSGYQLEEVHFLFIDSPLAPVVLGHPWLKLHNPHINWQQGSVLSWSEHCHAVCLVSDCLSLFLLQDEPIDLSNVPTEYLDLKGVFSKS